MLLPRVGRPPSRLGQPEDPRYAVIRYLVLRNGLLHPGEFDGDTLLSVMLHSKNPIEGIFLPYLRYWVSQRATRTVVRQFDRWLDQAAGFRCAHPDVQLPALRWEKTEQQKAAEEPMISAAMNRLLEVLRLPMPPYPLNDLLSK
jgi:hypothetical protein